MGYTGSRSPTTYGGSHSLVHGREVPTSLYYRSDLEEISYLTSIVVSFEGESKVWEGYQRVNRSPFSSVGLLGTTDELRVKKDIGRNGRCESLCLEES